MSRKSRLTSDAQLKVMGVDLMQFSINTARSRFLRLALEFFDASSDLYRDSSKSAPCVGSSCAVKSFPIACAGSGLHMPWILPGSFSKYISVYPINHFDDQGSEKLVSRAPPSPFLFVALLAPAALALLASAALALLAPAERCAVFPAVC